MTANTWMIYGAYGYTGRLIAAEAVRRGHRPILAGRSAARLAPLSEQLGLTYRAFELNDQRAMGQALAEVALLLNTAGPFQHTSQKMVHGCLEGHTHYLDISGDLNSCSHLLAQNEAARKRNILLLPGAAFAVVASDCLAGYVAGKLAQPVQLEIATATSITSQPSPGTAKSSVEMIAEGCFMRQQGKLSRIKLQGRLRRIQFIGGEQPALPLSLGDLATAYHSTAIPQIQTFVALPLKQAEQLVRYEPWLRRLYAFAPLRRLAQRQAARNSQGPDPSTRQTGRSQLWARASNQAGQTSQAWLETMEAYQFSAIAAVQAVEQVFKRPKPGALTPSQAFGIDFVLQIPGSQRFDQLPQRQMPPVSTNR